MVDAQNQGVPAKSPITQLAARVPLDLMVGERDAASFGLVDDGPASVKAIVKRFRSNKVETFPSALHGYKLLHFEPNMPASVIQFLEGTIKAKNDEWEGRYSLQPRHLLRHQDDQEPGPGRPRRREESRELSLATDGTRTNTDKSILNPCLSVFHPWLNPFRS